MTLVSPPYRLLGDTSEDLFVIKGQVAGLSLSTPARSNSISGVDPFAHPALLQSLWLPFSKRKNLLTVMSTPTPNLTITFNPKDS